MVKSVLIRPMECHDNAAIAAIIRAAAIEFNTVRPGTVYFDPDLDRLWEYFQREGSAYWVTEWDGQVVGGGGIYPTSGLPAGVCELTKVYLSPQARGLGVGQQLVARCLHSAGALGYQKVYLETLPELRDATFLYEKLGFTHLLTPLSDGQHFACTIWMLLDSVSSQPQEQI